MGIQQFDNERNKINPVQQPLVMIQSLLFCLASGGGACTTLKWMSPLHRYVTALPTALVRQTTYSIGSSNPRHQPKILSAFLGRKVPVPFGC